ncbi:helix-turn-helix transcriptional regulator [Anaerovorax odorimutans]|uniref:helix-turn-helix transcriptional regulator n=1 Tax=Anaerovorax odorimutans TaxID=109327 RepID=UPI000418F38E|nr:LuxR C-terminal-related transcriptional regulator [Anaerovorax odorimutans]
MSYTKELTIKNYPHMNDIFITDRLKQRLLDMDRFPITTVIAPMGYGKTTAMDWWVKYHKRHKTGTILLKQIIVTDSVIDFWNGFCRAFRDYPELAGQLKELGYPEDTRAMSVMTELLEDALEQSNYPIRFVMDDLHIFSHKHLVTFLIFLSRRLPDCVHIILLSRNQIFSSDERMRMGITLYEITADDLRLSETEVGLYAKRCGLNFSSRDIKTLSNMSEGWISMIYLNFKAYVQTGKLTAETTDIFTIINQVLLEPLMERHREFLILTGMMDEFTVKQVEYLWQQPDAKMILKSLFQNNAFIKLSETGIYRCHHMLRQCVRIKFTKKPIEYQRKNLSLLGWWYLKEKEYVLADFAFAQAFDWEGLLTSLGEDRAKSLHSEHSNEFFRWIKECPEEYLLKFPITIVSCMVKMFSFHNISEILRLKKLLLRALEQDNSLTEEERNNLLGDAEVSESFLSYNNISAMSEYHRRACTLLGRTSVSIDQKGAWTFSAPSIFMMYHRTVGGADSENMEMQECMPYFYKLSDGHGSGAEHGFYADLCYERGIFTDADIFNRKARAAAKRKNQFSIMIDCDFLSIRLALFKGDSVTMEKLLAESQEWLRQERQYTLLSTLDMCQGFIYAQLGHSDDAPEWFREGRLSEALVMFPATPMLLTFYNQLLLAKKQWTEVIARREECEELYSVYNNVLCEIWLHIQLASAYSALSCSREAKNELNIALDMALPDGIVMPFAENYCYISKELATLQKSGIYTDEIRKIISLGRQFNIGKRKILQGIWGEDEDYGLTKRELEIAKLAAQRRMNLEIAKMLHLSESTVKNQLNRIFDKLHIVGDGRNKRLELEKMFYLKK